MARPATRDPIPPTEWPYPRRGVAVTVREASVLLGVSRRTLYRMAEDGEVTSTGQGDDMLIDAIDLFVRAFHGTERPRLPLAEMLREAARKDLLHTTDPLVRATLTVTGIPEWLIEAHVAPSWSAFVGTLENGPDTAL